MARILIKVEDDTLGNSSFVSGDSIDDISMNQNPESYYRSTLVSTFDSMIARVKRAYRLPKTSPWTPEELGAAAEHAVKYLGEGDGAVGQALLRYLSAGEDQ
jgi:hypothetical protein